jgi:hypothetical protein
MRRRQKNIYSLLDRIGVELTDEDEKAGTIKAGGRDSLKGRMEKVAKGVTPEGVNEREPDTRLEEKTVDPVSMTSSDFIDREVCPQCEKTKLVRVRRKRWMRMFPGSEHHRCLECEANFLVVGHFKIKLKKGKS